MELQQYLTIMKERWGTAALVAVLVLAVVAALTLTRAPSYTATNRVFVQTEAGGSVSERSSGVNFASQQIITYADLARTPLVLEPVIEELELDLTPQELANRVSTQIPEDTLIIDITAWSPDPQLAAEIANATSESLRDQVAALEAPSRISTANSETGLGSSTVELTVVSPAIAPDSASSPDVPRDLGIGLVLALLAAVAAAVVRDFLDNRVRRPADIEALFDRPVIGTIPGARSSEQLPLIAVHQPQSVQAEAYRELRTNLHFMLLAGHMNTVLVTSSILGEGKTSSAINLAQALAEAGSRVLLVDADLRRPALATQLGLESTAGLTTVLIGEAALRDVSQPLDTEGLDVLTSGPIPPNPSELLGSAEMKMLLDSAAKAYDYVVVDTAPLLAVTDAAALSRFVDGALVVAQCDRVKKQQLGAALAKLDSVDAHVLGVIVNRTPRDSREAYTYTADDSVQDHGYEEKPAVDRSDAQPSGTAAPSAQHESDPVDAHARRADASLTTRHSRGSARRPAEPTRSPHRASRDAEDQVRSLTASGMDRPAGRSR